MPVPPAASDWFAIVFSAAIVAWIAVWLVRRYAPRLGLIDQPNHRSSHKQPTPSGGGIGIVLGAATGLLVAVATGTVLSVAAWTIVAAAMLVAAVGLVDDIRSLPPGVRLLAQTAAAASVVAATGPLDALPLPAPLNVHLPAVLGWICSLLWIAAVTNFFNFMDGIDGLAGGQAVASLCGILVAAWSADASVVAVCTGTAALGFLMHNWAPARVFMGDVGSGFLGFLIAALPFLASAGRRADAVVAIAVGLALFLADPLETLFRRARAGKPVAGAHREHTYQQFLGPGDPAGAIAGTLVAAGLGLALLGAVAYRAPGLGWAALAVAGAAYLTERWLAQRRSSGRGMRL